MEKNMKKMFFLFLTVLLFSGLSYSQITVTAGSVSAAPGDSVTIPISVTNFSAIGAITLVIQYPSGLSWGRMLNADPQVSGMLAGNSNGKITITWDAIAGMTLASGKLLDLKFLYTGGTDTLKFTTACEIADINTIVKTVSYTNGIVKPLVTGLSGNYYIGAAGTAPGGTNPNFATLKSAIDTLNKSTITGNCNFYITSNLTEPANMGLGVNPGTYTITFKPYTGTVDTVTFTQSTDNAGCSGAWVIGITDLSSTAYPIVPTRNVIIDGSNSANGTTRDLAFRTVATSNTNQYPFRIFGDVSNFTIKNCKVTTGQSVSYGIAITNRNASSINYTPSNITINNCEINNLISLTGQGIGISSSGTPTAFPTGIVFSNNNINAKTRGIFLNFAGSTDIFGNEITINQNNTGYVSSYIYAYVIGNTTTTNFTTNIYNNKMVSISSANATAANGIYGIWVNTRGTYNIYNNFVAGFNATTTAANPSFVLNGIRVDNAEAIAKIYNNSIYIPDVAFTKGTGSWFAAGIYLSNGADTLVNNVIVSDKSADSSYVIYRSGTAGTVYSNNNDLYASASLGMVGYWTNTAAKTLADWKTASSQDAASISLAPGFKSATDLHLSSSATAPMGKGIPISWITKDIDGETRDNPSELGADEIPGITPVELTSFTASAGKNSVKLTWSTATETNNSNFVIEKKTANSAWAQVGTIAGKGTTTEKQNYSFVDTKITSDKVTYRLRQNDFDGSYSYSKEIEVATGVTPSNFDLSQNYPNPFNPSTAIKFSVPFDSKVKIEVYSVTGQLVSTLFNGYKSAGNYEVTMKADNLSSGVYIYKLSAGSVTISKKMQLLK
jgi:hypothetical protein